MTGPQPFTPPADEHRSGSLGVSGATLDLFDLGRRASAARDLRWGHRATFVRSRQLLATGAWRGPRDATESYVEVADLGALTPTATASAADRDDPRAAWKAAAAAGAGLLLGGGAPRLHEAVRHAGARSLWRLAFRGGESASDRGRRIDDLRAVVRGGLTPWGVMPTPDGEAEGIDTLHLVAVLRLELPEIPHVVLDVAALGPRLAQMALGFGADELWAPIVSERALRLGGNANNPAMTRKEACVLIRGAGLSAFERTAPDEFREEQAQ